MSKKKNKPEESKSGLLFMGTEAEGPYRGIPTLFVGNKEVSYWAILRALALHREIKQVYFGANDNYGISEENAKHIHELLMAGFLVTVEIIEVKQTTIIPETIRPLTHIVMNIPSISKHGVSAVKFVTDSAVNWYDLRTVNPVVNSLGDPIYSEDMSV